MDSAIPIAVAAISLLVAGVIDFKTLRIYNWLTLPLLFGGLAYHAYFGGLEGLGASFGSALVAFAAMLFMYLLGGMGAGDVKLAAALGAWLGLQLTLVLLAIGLLLSALISLVVLARQRRLSHSWLHFQLALMRLAAVAQHVSRDGSDHEDIHDLAQSAAGRSRLIPFSVMLAGSMVLLMIGLYMTRAN